MVVQNFTPGPRYASASADALTGWRALGDDEIAELLAAGIVTLE